jgi:TonB family protein
METETKKETSGLSTEKSNLLILKKSYIISAIFHLLIIIPILVLPKPPKTEFVLPSHRIGKPMLSPVKVPSRPEEKSKNENGSRIAEDRGSILSMIDSNKKIKGFVRNLFYAQSETFDLGKREETGENLSANTGLFTKIENAPAKIKREELREIGPLFAAVEGSGKVTKEGKGVNFVESELKTETPEIQGTLNSEMITKTVASGEGALRYCYEEALIRKPQVKGRAVVLFKIGPEGQVESSSIESSSLEDKPFEQCILTKVRQWRFPKPEGGTATIRYPFVFYTTSKG